LWNGFPFRQQILQEIFSRISKNVGNKDAENVRIVEKYPHKTENTFLAEFWSKSLRQNANFYK
jgi:hypothetical protein